MAAPGLTIPTTNTWRPAKETHLSSTLRAKSCRLTLCSDFTGQGAAKSLLYRECGSVITRLQGQQTATSLSSPPGRAPANTLCRATTGSSRASSLEQEESSSEASEVPSCCSGSSSKREASLDDVRIDDPEESVSAGYTQGSQAWIFLAAAIGVGLAFVLTNPSALPFDVDDIQDWLDEAVYQTSHEINRAVSLQLGGGASPLGSKMLGLVFGAGLVTSFAPCTLSVLPLTIGYIAGFRSDADSEQSERQSPVLLNALFFSLGLASTFSALGITAALAGKAYGQMGPGLPIAVSALTMYMGLNLLGLVRFQMPSLFANFDAKEAAARLPVPVQMYLGGLTFALLASPCSTPVLASLLGYVASSEDVLVGFALLLAYTFGRVMPVLAAASFTGSMKQMLSLRKYSKWVNPASGALLLGIGTFSMLSRIFPDSTAMAMGLMSTMGDAIM